MILSSFLPFSLVPMLNFFEDFFLLKNCDSTLIFLLMSFAVLSLTNFPTWWIFFTPSFQKGIFAPSLAIGEFPSLANIFHALRIATIGKTSAEKADFGTYHPKSSWPASHVKEVLIHFLMQVYRSFKKCVYTFVKSHANILTWICWTRGWYSYCGTTLIWKRNQNNG